MESSDTISLTARLTRSWLWCAAAVIGGIAGALYWGSLPGGFVWDDVVLVDGTGIGGGTVAGCFRTAFLQHYYRPLVSLSFLIDRLLWPDNPAAYRLVNIVLHALASVVVAALAWEAFGRRSLAMSAGLLYAVHPVHVGATAWIGGRTDTLGCLWTSLFALGLIMAARRHGHQRTMCMAGALVSFALAAFTKEQTLFLLPMAPIAFWCWRPGRGVADPRDGWYAGALFAVVTILYLSIGAFLGLPGIRYLGATPAIQVERFGQSVTAYAQTLLLPDLGVLHSFSLERWADRAPLSVVIGYVIVVTSLWACFFLWRRNRPAAWFLIMIILSLAPVLNILPLPFLLFAPYRAATASIGVSVLLARFIGSIRLKRGGFRAAPAALALSALCTVYVVLTLEVIPSWRTERGLFTAVRANDPGAMVAHYMLAREAAGAGRYHEAAECLGEMLARLYRSRAWRRAETSWNAMKTDRYVRMRVLQNQGDRRAPEAFLAELYMQLGYARVYSGDAAGAVEAFQTSVGWERRSGAALHGLGWSYMQMKRWPEAERALLAALEVAPSNDVRKLLAQVFERQGRYQEAYRQSMIVAREELGHDRR